jgi:hypothetical protein
MQQITQICHLPQDYLIMKLNRTLDTNLQYDVELDIPVNRLKIKNDDRFDLITVITTETFQDHDDEETRGYQKVYNRNLQTNEWFCYANAIVFKASFEEIKLN